MREHAFGFQMAGAGLFFTAGWLRLVAGGWFVLRGKYCWLVADKPSEQDPRLHICVPVVVAGPLVERLI
jgi:hypothetical protein